MPNRRGLTLIEVLAVIAIIAIIACLVLPALLSAKKEARATDDLSKLKQLGMAANLYHDQTGSWPRGVSDVISVGLAPKELCSLSNDTTQKGLANSVADNLDKVPVLTPAHLALPYRNSCIGVRENRLPEDEISKWIEPGPAGGWILDFTEAKLSDATMGDPSYLTSTGTYRRLCYDGAVVRRPFKKYMLVDQGKPQEGISPLLLFVDPTEEMLQWLRSR